MRLYCGADSSTPQYVRNDTWITSVCCVREHKQKNLQAKDDLRFRGGCMMVLNQLY